MMDDKRNPIGVFMAYLIMVVSAIGYASCAPMPGNTLFPELDHATPLEKVEVIETIDFFETQKYCTQYCPWYQVALNCVTNFCLIPACAIPFHNVAGDIKKCYIYMWVDSDLLRRHEERHCMGYKDLLY